MAAITVKKNPRVYRFEVGSYVFEIALDFKDHTGVHPIEVLKWELQSVLNQLNAMPLFEVKDQFTLPPLNPNDESGK